MFLSRGISRSTVLAAMSGTEHEHFRDRPPAQGSTWLRGWHKTVLFPDGAARTLREAVTETRMRVPHGHPWAEPARRMRRAVSTVSGSETHEV
jgi:hypothetical protein